MRQQDKSSGPMGLREAVEIAHTLSNPSKMPGYSYSTPASACITGSKLRDVPGTACSFCYAQQGRYGFANVQAALMKRLRGTGHPNWQEAMKTLLSQEKVTKFGHFRWFDSGDLRSVDQLRKIVAVARSTPMLQHWLPTREYAMLKEFMESGGEIPDNLTIRVSATKVDGKPPGFWPTTSTIHLQKEPIGHVCPAPDQDNACGDCRACWDREVGNVSYHLHGRSVAQISVIEGGKDAGRR